jgi:pimeloyl-ACP methyl ester carboxylesterase
VTEAVAPEPRRLFRPIRNGWGDGEMAVLEFGRADRPVDLIFLHANGFNALTYRSLLAPLGRTHRVWAPDLRGHGRSRLPTSLTGRRSWSDHRDDLLVLLSGLESPAPLVAGHSIGGVTALLAAAERPELFRGLLLLDPVIWTRSAIALFQLPVSERLMERAPIVKGARARRSRFPSREAAFETYRKRAVFGDWPDGVLRDYLEDGLVSDGEEMRLACDPAWEASNYVSQAHDPRRALRRYPGPVEVVKAQTGSLCRLRDGRRGSLEVSTAADTHHLFPITQADRTRAIIEHALG